MRCIIIILISILSSSVINAQGFLKVKDSMIINGANKEIILRGMGLGGWMLQEPYMLGLSGAASAQYDIRNKIIGVIGKENTNKFYDAWLANHCTKGDIDSLAAWGFNSIRLPMHYNLFTLSVEAEPVKGKNTWLSKGFALTDSLLKWCKANHIYLILDLHATPGGQGNDNAISDREASKPSLWQDSLNRKKTIALWEKLAERYAKEEWIGGYDLINEPNWGFDNEKDKNGCDEKNNVLLKALLKDITAAVRKVDRQHIIFIEGNCWANNYNGIYPLWDDNIVVSFHKYWNYNDVASIQKFLDYRKTYNVPIWLGETGENSNAWFTDAISLMEKNKIGWAMWPLKKSGSNNPLQVKINDGAKLIFDYWRGKADKPGAAAAFESLLQFAKNTNIKNNTVHHDVIDAMIRQVGSSQAVPFKQNSIKAGAYLFAVDYDMGRSGIAWHDIDSAEYWVSTKTRTPWNSGGQYRNDGVDIEKCADSISNGYNVGWIQDGEWLQYTVNAAAAETFDIHIRYAAKNDSGKLQLFINDIVAAETILPSTGDLKKWRTAVLKNIKLQAGVNRLRILSAGNSFNLNYLQFLEGGKKNVSISK